MNKIILIFAALVSLAAAASAQPSALVDLQQFERKAVLSKELGATHVVITEGLPLATWEADSDDPYPAWFMHHISMLKVFPPKDVQPYVNAAYAANVSAILEKRCEILRKLGLKAIWNANEPAVMPEAFFTAFPELRGPRIDQPNRSTKAHFAPSSDDPEMLRMYRESIQLLLRRCPDVELFNWVTTDAGSGFDYAPGLYPGPNGNTKYKNRPMEERVSGFMINIQKAAKEAGRDIAIHLRPIEPRQWMVPTFSPEVLRAIVRLLPRGLAVQGDCLYVTDELNHRITIHGFDGAFRSFWGMHAVVPREGAGAAVAVGRKCQPTDRCTRGAGRPHAGGAEQQPHRADQG